MANNNINHHQWAAQQIAAMLARVRRLCIAEYMLRIGELS